MHRQPNVMNTHRQRRAGTPQAGFTLIEIMVVVVILGLLATLVVPNLFEAGEEAKKQKAQTDVKTIYGQAQLFKLRNNRTPTMEDLTTEDDKGKTYIDEVDDPWGNPYQIRDLDRGKFEVISWGPDGSEQTEDDITSTPKSKDR
jgi:general secretion pathway protein G